MKRSLLLISMGFFAIPSFGQNVTIPDANFKAFLVGNASINTNMDTEIQVSEATAYNNVIWCAGLNISDMTGIEAFTGVTAITCSNNQLTFLDLSSCTSLTSIVCSNNLLTSIICNNGLEQLLCDNNLLSTLDISSYPNINFFDCQQNNTLTSLNVANGNNSNFTYFVAHQNPSLTCIEVDNAYWSETHWFNVDVQTEFSVDCGSGIGCTVTIPDINFKAYLVGNTAINTNADTEIQCTEAQAFAGTIDCQNLSISDLTGIEAFTNLTILFCEDNLLTSLDIGSNTALTRLFCDNNELTSLNTSNNVALEDLGCDDNQITMLDFSNNSSLAWLNCEYNDLTSLDLSANPAISYLNCNHNDISALNMTNNTNLGYLYCNYNLLTSVDVTNCANLIIFSCINNDLTSIDVNNSPMLEQLNCPSNLLVSLDISSNIALTLLICENNQLSSLNVANGNNSNIVNGLFSALNNPSLTCIEVDDAAYSTTNWTNIDVQHTFSEDCSGTTSVTNLPENNQQITVYPNPTSNMIRIQTDQVIETISLFDIQGNLLKTESELNFSVSELPQGVYLLSIKTNYGITRKRFIKN